MKRIFDLFFALFCLFLSLPLWLIFVLMIWLEDRGPVLFLQDRVGRGGGVFKSMQFRSMKPGADKITGPMQAKENDARVTSIGRLLRATAMDELPQLLNIVKGEMSFVGPRALRPLEKEVYDDEPKSIWEYKGAKERCQVAPGLTGIAQILLPRDAPREAKFEYDIWYINNQNFVLDIYTIIFSFLITFLGRWERRENKFSSLTILFRNKFNIDPSS